MAALDFPNSPSVDQVYTANGSSWVWTGAVWNLVPAAGSSSGGLDLITKVDFTAQATVSVNGCFTAAYDNYRVLVRLENNGSAGNVTMRLRAAGTDESGATSYLFCGRYSLNGAVGEENVTTSSWRVTENRAGYVSVSLIELSSPALAVYTAAWWNVGTMGSIFDGGNHFQAVAYDGFSLLGTGMTGSVSIFGYRKA